jgi:hypothetical protein
MNSDIVIGKGFLNTGMRHYLAVLSSFFPISAVLSILYSPYTFHLPYPFYYCPLSTLHPTLPVASSKCREGVYRASLDFAVRPGKPKP